MTAFERKLASMNRVYWAAHCYINGDDDGLARAAEASRLACEAEARERLGAVIHEHCRGSDDAEITRMVVDARRK
jgi:hypothetical protein